jgi:glycosyltransferase involved in cell wall biosynthesis
MTNIPKLTIIIPCYNFEKYIQTCIESILNQKLNFSYEILIHDDKSTDKTFEIIQNLYSNKSNIKITQSNINCGITENLKILFKKSLGSYIFLLDGDDYLTDEYYLQRAVDFLDNNEKYVMYCSGYKTLYPDGTLIPNEELVFLCGLKDDILREDLCSVNYITFARVFRNYKNYVQNWMNDLIHEDWAINSEILKYGIAKCERDKCVGIYRITNIGRITSLTPEQRLHKDLKTIDLIIKNTHNTNKVIIHIHLFLNTEELEKMAYENLKNIKSQGFDILVTSPKKLPLYFYDVIDIFYHDKENQLLKLNYTDIEVMWHWIKNDIGTLSLGVKELQKHGLAVLRSMIKGCQLAKLNNYKYIIRCEFDDLFGPISFLNIKNKLDYVIENNFDFNLIRNVYSYYTDISVHLMFYNCEKFLSLFGSIVDEKTYNDELCNLGIPKKSTMLETFIYLMIEHYKLQKELFVNYDDTSVIQNEYFDTRFNVHQNCFSLSDGVLSDVTYIFINNVLSRKKLCLATRNFSSLVDIDVDFEIKRKTTSDIQTITLNSGGIGCWNIFYLDFVEDLDTIYIRNRNKDHHKKYKVIIDENNFHLMDLDINEYGTSRLEITN